jgi:cyclo(L-tyrosyl-L-tyrosyl) synthase
MDTFDIEPYSNHCAYLADKAEHALIGLSLGNSYFAPSRIRSLISWAASTFTTIDVFIPDVAALQTLLAAGTDPHLAKGKVCRALKKLRNPARTALDAAGISRDHLHTGPAITFDPRYQELHHAAQVAYRQDPVIRRACQDLARQVLSTAEPTDQQLDAAAVYALAELPLLLDSPAIFGVSSSVVVYHRRVCLADALRPGSGATLTAAPGQGYTIVTPR